MTRLETIVTRQRKGRVRDVIFAAFLGLAAVIGATSMTTCSGANSSHVAQR